MPSPWKGGWWRLGDIVRYELASHRSLLATAAARKSGILESRNRLCTDEVERGRTEPPFYFVLPPKQHDRGALPDLVALLREHGIEMRLLTRNVEVGGTVLDEGSAVIPLAQPYRAFVKEVMEDQRFPVRHYVPGGDVIRPYDITSWSLPRHRGLKSREIDVRAPQLEAALGDLPEEYSARMNTSEPPKDFAALAWPTGDNASHAVAWAALADGLDVRRLTTPMSVGETTLAAGSFVVSGKQSVLKTLSEEAAGRGAVGYHRLP